MILIDGYARGASESLQNRLRGRLCTSIISSNPLFLPKGDDFLHHPPGVELRQHYLGKPHPRLCTPSNSSPDNHAFARFLRFMLAHGPLTSLAQLFRGFALAQPTSDLKIETVLSEGLEQDGMRCGNFLYKRSNCNKSVKRMSGHQCWASLRCPAKPRHLHNP